jgi:hypothetical protein
MPGYRPVGDLGWAGGDVYLLGDPRLAPDRAAGGLRGAGLRPALASPEAQRVPDQLPQAAPALQVEALVDRLV